MCNEDKLLTASTSILPRQILLTCALVLGDSSLLSLLMRQDSRYGALPVTKRIRRESLDVQK